MAFLMESGQYSYARVIGFLAFLVCVGITVLGLLTNQAGQVIDVQIGYGALIIAPYAVNKTAEVFNRLEEKRNAEKTG